MKDFTDIIKNTNYCIVGNSPSEVGKGNGELIDSYETVIRFKNYDTDSEFAKDYGEKTTVWATPFNRTQFYRDPDEYECIICTLPLHIGKWRSFYGPSNIDYDLLAKYKGLIEFIPQDIFEEVRQYYKTGQPSSGMHTLYWIYKLVGHIDTARIFGFSMFKPEEDHHYFLHKELDAKQSKLGKAGRALQRTWFGHTDKTHPRKFEEKVFSEITF